MRRDGGRAVKPVMQTKRGGADVAPEERGDCWSACLASILEVPIEAVAIPHSDDPDWHWWDASREALAPHGCYPCYADKRVYPDGYWIAQVPSLNLGTLPNGQPVPHVIVMRTGEVAHDPSLGERYAVGTSVEDLNVTGAFLVVPFETRSIAA